MKDLRWTKIALLLLACVLPVLLTCCSGTFIPDPVDPRLPKYTEEGNNVAGCFVNGETWESVVSYGFSSSSNGPIITSYPSEDSLVVEFTGNVEGEVKWIAFSLQDVNVTDFWDLEALEGIKIPLDGEVNEGLFRAAYNMEYLRGGVGQLLISEVIMDDSSTTVSGTFGFRVEDSLHGEIAVTYGRFDYKFSPDRNFIVE